MKPLMKLLIGITLGILLGASVDAAVGTFTFKTTGASDTVEAVSLVYPQRVPEAGSVTNDKLAEPISVANGGTGATTAAAGLVALGGASLNGSSTVDFAAANVGAATLGVTGHSTLKTVSATTLDVSDQFSVGGSSFREKTFFVSNVGGAVSVASAPLVGVDILTSSLGGAIIEVETIVSSYVGDGMAVHRGYAYAYGNAGTYTTGAMALQSDAIGAVYTPTLAWVGGVLYVNTNSANKTWLIKVKAASHYVAMNFY